MRAHVALLAILLATAAQAQQRQPASVTTLPTTSPQEFDLLDAAGAWVQFITVNSVTHSALLTVPVQSSVTVSDPAIDAALISWGGQGGYGPNVINKLTTYSGGASNQQIGALWVNNVVSNAGNLTGQIALAATMQNSSKAATPAGSNIGILGQGDCLVAGCSGTWGANLVAQDTSAQANPPNPFIGLEVDVYANGPDTGAKRAGVLVTGGKGPPVNAGGAAPAIARGIDVGDQGDGTHFGAAFSVDAHSVQYGFTVVDGAIQSAASGGLGISLGSETATADSNSQAIGLWYRADANVRHVLQLSAVGLVPGGLAALFVFDPVLANGIALAPAKAASPVAIIASGSDANISIVVQPKGTGGFVPNADNTTLLGTQTARWAGVYAALPATPSGGGGVNVCYVPSTGQFYAKAACP